MVVALVHGLEEVGVGRLFVRGGERFFRKLAVLAREADQLALIDADAEEIPLVFTATSWPPLPNWRLMLMMRFPIV